MNKHVAELPADYVGLLAEVKERVLSARYAALKSVNKELVGLYWDIGRMIVERQVDSAHGDAIVERLTRDLQAEFPRLSGFSRRNVFYMREFYLVYRGLPKVQPLVAQIGWTHNLTILQRCKEPLEREFYIRMTRKFGWTKNVLIHQIDNQSYQKYLLGQTNFDQAITPELRDQAYLAVRDEYTFDFLELGDEHSEFYLTALDRDVREADENPSIGIILCKEKNRTVVEYALHDARKPIGVATYRISRQLPKELEGQLPSPQEIARLLNTVE